MIGYLFILAYIAFCAYSFVFAATLPTYTAPLLLFFVALLGILFLHLIKLFKIKPLYKKASKHLGLLFGMNFAGIGWLCALYAMNYVQPPVMLCLNMGMVPITHFIVTTHPKNYTNHKATLLAITGIIGSMLLIITQTSHGSTLLAPHQMGWGIGLSLLDGVGGACNGIFSYKLTQKKFSASDIMLFRFFLLMIASGILAYQNNDFVCLSRKNVPDLIKASWLMFLVPMFIYQKAIVYLGASVVSLFIPFIPICAYCIQLYRNDYPFDAKTFGGLLVCSLTICTMHIISSHKKSKHVGDVPSQ